MILSLGLPTLKTEHWAIIHQGYVCPFGGCSHKKKCTGVVLFSYVMLRQTSPIASGIEELATSTVLDEDLSNVKNYSAQENYMKLKIICIRHS